MKRDDPQTFRLQLPNYLSIQVAEKIFYVKTFSRELRKTIFRSVITQILKNDSTDVSLFSNVFVIGVIRDFRIILEIPSRPPGHTGIYLTPPQRHICPRDEMHEEPQRGYS